ncbi:MAG: malto-oligosyltrehalose synthase [Drouetiella hepatica Uher 2000/2452]|uniref:Malto-oligosyltrehalose synthase n=1 Tax=Drouetiella hepatica Uher 2000/2452 TaxID=904376 RepID=A0A951QFP3_9CYAN|nr:malto-oligosyltrehalose synthase [Drouetiella hepatica Uher 2000/2452]
MQIPLATYRIQFSAAFDFDAAKAIVPYLNELGISDLYASPIFTARQGSTHGYDVVNPLQINPELGGLEKFELLSQELQQHKLGWLQDIVPNHMAFDSQNQMLVDVLENGPDSQYRNFFDIDWNHPYGGINGRVLAPFLGKFYGDCLESGELQIQYSQNGLSIHYYGLSFPLRIESYGQVLMHDLGRLRDKISRNHPDFVKFLGVLYALKYIPSGESGRERYDQINFIKSMLWELWQDSQEVKQYFEANIDLFNGETGKPESFNLLDNLLSEQFFRLSYWKVGNEELNYRRFFTVNELISLRVEDQKVFDTIHGLTLQLVEEGKITGLRVDHIDGLYNPGQYLNRLREHSPEVYITVEKILEPHEELPLNWPIQGTTGYDFMSKLNCLFCQQTSEAEFDSIYYNFIGKSTSCETLIDENKRLMIGKHLAGDIDNLAHLLKLISDRHRYASDFTMYGLKRALVEILAMFPIYRTYISREGSRKADQECMKQVMQRAQENAPSFVNELSFIEKFLLLDFDDHLSHEDKELWMHFLMRMQQFTGPLMAKGVEDTVFYVYNRLISLNEVGSSACQFGISIEEFHNFNQSRSAQWPHALSASATHDTKRGEDVRARINVLSELPEEWQEHLKNWSAINAPLKDNVTLKDSVTLKDNLHSLRIPTANDEYLLYQALLGSFPFDETEYPQFIDRIKDYIIKAIREAKVNSNWMRPETAYEEGFTKFIERILENTESNLFLQTFKPFQQKIQHYGILNSLSQTLLKIASPGVPDFYQGTELWDLSLVDPDNRRPVDFKLRLEYLKEIKSKIKGKSKGKGSLLSYIAEILKTPEDGRIKLFLTYRALQIRQTYQEMFRRGGYEKLTVLGSLKAHIVAFARDLGETRMIVIVPRFLTSLVKQGEFPLGEQVWHETRIVQPPGSSSVWQDAITGQSIEAEDTLWLKEILTHFPVALLIGKIEAGFTMAPAIETLAVEPLEFGQ